MSPETIDRREAQEQVKLALERVALMHAALARVLVEELGPQEGRRLVEKVIDRYGRDIGRACRRRTEALGLPLTPANYQGDLPALGFDSERLQVEPWRVRVHGCPLARVWREMDLAELGSIYCRVDQAKYRAYNPDLVCRHQVHTLRDGASFCELVISRGAGEEPAEA